MHHAGRELSAKAGIKKITGSEHHVKPSAMHIAGREVTAKAGEKKILIFFTYNRIRALNLPWITFLLFSAVFPAFLIDYAPLFEVNIQHGKYYYVE